jgi:hypothetical protein
MKNLHYSRFGVPKVVLFIAPMLAVCAYALVQLASMLPKT